MQLDDLYDDQGPERVGFVLLDGSIVEVENIAEDPENGFDVKPSDMVAYASVASATWHTHPGSHNNLSVKDYNAFKSWPQLDHYVIGKNGTRCYQVVDGDVLIK